MMDWIKDLLAKNRQATNSWRYGQKEKKICQWVENATEPQCCSGIVTQKGTIYCSYHTQVWKEMLKEEADAS